MAGCAVLILAGGSGTRLGAPIPKQYLPLAGRSVIARATAAFVAHPAVDAVRVVIAEGDEELYATAMQGLDLLAPVVGGATRQESGLRGLESLEELGPDTVLIHDAARPLVDSAVIDRVIAALELTPAALPALPVSDTLKRGVGLPPMVGETVDRAGLWRAQTPQGFRYPDILNAHRAAAGLELTDDAAVAEHAGLAIALVRGEEENFKVTTQDDLERAERTIAGGAPAIRFGTGFDVHALGPGDRVILCGVAVPHDRSLTGHSDSDVALHALTDALLGAIAEADIGAHFPPSEEKWRGASSDIFVRHAADLVAEKGGEIENVDVTIICERPRIGPHREAMRTRIAEILGIDRSRVSVKATTTEGLGFTGRGEGIAAQAAATVRLPGDR